MTKVIFRKWREGGEIIALFPEIPWNADRGTITSYMYIGQHGDADYRHVLGVTTPAREDEYKYLLSELKRIGYDDLKVLRRFRSTTVHRPPRPKIIVTNISEGIAFYPELAGWVRSCGRNPHHPDFDALALMEGDPDKIKWGKYEMYFIEVERRGRKFILTSDEVDEQSKLMLERFHRPDFKRWYEEMPGDWDDFAKTESAIACRRGCNYYYTLWKYTGENK